MSENDTHVDHTTCAASGCPMLATHSRGTNGESEWLCFIHAAAEHGDRQRVTHELQRLGWIVHVVRELRAGRQITGDMHRSFVMAQRSDLSRKESEARSTWMIRLETVLKQSCKDSASPA